MKIRSITTKIGLTVAVLLSASCQTNEYGTVDLSDYEPEEEVGIVYNHPVALYTADDFERVKTALTDGTAPEVVQQEFNVLKNNTYTSGEYLTTNHVIELIVRGSNSTYSENYINANRDAAAAYQFGLLWLITGDETYAKRGIDILNAWVAGCDGIWTGTSDSRLAAGTIGFTFALAGEELRNYSGWTESSFTEFKNWMVEKFADLNYAFLLNHNGVTCGATHYWSNWDLVNLCSYLQIGILTENDDMVNYVTEYFRNSGIGNGNISKLCLAEKTDPLGTGESLMQNQESGRDQGHAEMSAAVTIQLCQAAWALFQSNPTLTDLNYYTANDCAILKMAEYVALTNLRDGSDNANANGSWLISASDINAKAWTTVGPWCTGADSHEASHQHTIFSETQRGGVRPGWETLLMHFTQVAPTDLSSATGTAYTKMMADKMRPECGAGDSRYGVNSGAFDQIGWGTLMMYQE
ncbi:MAG: alginate lyase family protein [Prevotella sp.]|nr:alginate lyase family protein [Prevotella sp.]